METARDLLGKREVDMKRLEKEAPNLVHGFREFRSRLGNPCLPLPAGRQWQAGFS
jgi:hypothetical protein